MLAVLFVLFNLCFITNISPTTVAVVDSTLPIYVNEKPSGYDAASINGQWYAKLRDICDIYCVEINYDNTTKIIAVYDKPSPILLKLFAGKIVGKEKMFVKNGQVYIPLNGVQYFNIGHMEQGHLDVNRTFSFYDGSWFYSVYGKQEQPLDSVDSYQQKGELSYAIFSTPDGDTLSNIDKVWEFDQAGHCRTVAEYWLRITSFAVDDDNVFIVGLDTWNASSVWKFSLADGTQTMLGQMDYDYGDNLSHTINNILANNNMEPLPHTGIIVCDDGVYTVGYSRDGYFENNIINKNIFLDTYGYYRLDKNGGIHEKVAEWPQ